MNKLSYLGYFTIFFVISFFSFGQVGLGQWRDHLPYTIGEKVIVAGSDVYMLTSAGLLKYGKNTNEMEKISKITGLNDSDIRTIAYHSGLDYVLIGYGNGNIDILSGNNIINISDIKRKSINAEKSINSVTFFEDQAYLGCSFGIVVLDLKKMEIKETWFIGHNASYIKINSLDIKDNIIFAATENGIYKGDLNESLVDFSKWEILTNNNFGNNSFSWLSGKSFNHLVFFDNKIISNYYNPNGNDAIIVFDGTQWSRLEGVSVDKTYSISSSENRLIIVRYGNSLVLDNEFNEVRSIWSYELRGGEVSADPADAFFDPLNGDLIWIADKTRGLVNYNIKDWKSEQFQINGPVSNKIFDLDSHGDNVYGVGGSVDLSWTPMYQPPLIYRFSNQAWTSFSRLNTPDISQYGDLVRIAVDPRDPSHFFCASWTVGLLEFRNNTFYKLHNAENSTLGRVGSTDNIRIGGISFDDEGNLWVTNTMTSRTIHKLTPEGNWHYIDYSSSVGININISKIIITRDNIKWVILAGGNGLFVFDDNGTPDDKRDDKYKKLNVINENGETISNDVYSIAEDKNGYIWVGTSKGVAVYYNPEDVFRSNITARQIKIPRKENSNEADLLLANELVTSIYVDGANKKWFGTRTGGVFYTSEDGVEEYFHFTTENSPLLDNNILAITVTPKSGEVFFGTARGIVSYRNTATEGEENYSDVYVFPNPVRENYDGPITITGLVAGSYVKITDISGKLVYEVRSDGGQAVWYGKDMSGRKVQTGVYLVFSTNETGSKTDITKIMFIN